MRAARPQEPVKSESGAEPPAPLVAPPCASEEAPCPLCAGTGGLMGELGPIAYYRCRHCGWTFDTG